MRELTLLPAVVLALMRDMRLSELLSESSLSICLRFVIVFPFVTGALASPSESLESNEGTFLDVVWDDGLGLEKASKMDGCFTSIRSEMEKQTMLNVQITGCISFPLKSYTL